MSDLWATATAGAGDAINAISNVATSIYDRWFQKKESDRNQQNVEWQKQFADTQFKYQQRENELLRQREDNAMQRRVADLKAAGLNPLTVLGATGAMANLGQTGGSQPSAGVPGRSVAGNAQLDLKIADHLMNQKLVQSQINLNDAEAEQKRGLNQTNRDIAELNANAQKEIAQLRTTAQVEQWVEQNKLTQQEIQNVKTKLGQEERLLFEKIETMQVERHATATHALVEEQERLLKQALLSAQTSAQVAATMEKYQQMKTANARLALDFLRSAAMLVMAAKK
jgi:hypothetical protein